MLTPVTNLQDVLCHFERLAPFGSGRVDSLVPPGYEKYARIFHPAWLGERQDFVPLRWDEVARYSGAVAHPLMQWPNISVPTIDGTAVDLPDEDSRPREVSRPLKEILLRHSKGNPCWLGIWPGFGGREYYREYVPATLSVNTGDREWDLFRAPLSMMDLPFYKGDSDQTANLVWCDDPGWWITTELDLTTTYIGGNEQLIREVLESADLEALPATPDDDITLGSDKVNPVRENPAKDQDDITLPPMPRLTPCQAILNLWMRFRWRRRPGMLYGYDPRCDLTLFGKTKNKTKK